MKCPSCRFGTHVPTLKYQRSPVRRQAMGVGLVRVAEHDVADPDGVGDDPRDLAQVAVIVDRRRPLDPAGGEPGHQRVRRARRRASRPRRVRGARHPQGGARHQPGRDHVDREALDRGGQAAEHGALAQILDAPQRGGRQPVRLSPARAAPPPRGRPPRARRPATGRFTLRSGPRDHLDVVVRQAERQQRVLGDEPAQVARDRVDVLDRGRIDHGDARGEVAHGEGRQRQVDLLGSVGQHRTQVVLVACRRDRTGSRARRRGAPGPGRTTAGSAGAPGWPPSCPR